MILLHVNFPTCRPRAIYSAYFFILATAHSQSCGAIFRRRYGYMKKKKKMKKNTRRRYRYTGYRTRRDRHNAAESRDCHTQLAQTRYALDRIIYVHRRVFTSNYRRRRSDLSRLYSPNNIHSDHIIYTYTNTPVNIIPSSLYKT